MKKITVLLTILTLNGCFFKANNKEKNEYPYLVESVETFFNQHYFYPKNMEALKHHIKDRTTFDILFKKLNRNDKLSLTNSKNKVYIVDNSVKDTLAEIYKFEFCERLKGKKFPRFYLEDWAMYRNGNILQKNEVDSLGLRKIKQTMQEFSEQDLPPYHRKYDFIRFVNDNLIFKCTQMHNAVYEDSIKYHLKKFTLENRIDSIYFFMSMKQY